MPSEITEAMIDAARQACFRQLEGPISRPALRAIISAAIAEANEKIERLERENSELRRYKKMSHVRALDNEGLRDERNRAKASVERLKKAAERILPYLTWTIGPESPGHHPTMPSAVAAFRAAFQQEGESDE